jgi:hypothetical protein
MLTLAGYIGDFPILPRQQIQVLHTDRPRIGAAVQQPEF